MDVVAVTAAPRPVLGAHLAGFAAFYFAPVLAAAVPRLEDLGREGRVDPVLLGQARGFAAAAQVAADQWATWRASVDGNTEVSGGEAVGGSGRDLDMSTARAADTLGVSPRRVRQLLDAGVLTGRRAGRVWLVDVDSVRSLKHHRDLRRVS